MPARCSRWASTIPAGPAPMIATCVRIWPSRSPSFPDRLSAVAWNAMDAALENLDNSSRVLWAVRQQESMQTSAIPNFFLYGEAPRTVDDRFLHLEALEDRSRPSGWTI